MRKLMLMLTVLVLCLLAGACGAEEARVTLDALSFAPPDGLAPLALTGEAADAGVRYAAQSGDGTLRMLVVCREAKRGDAAAPGGDDRVTVGESVTVGGTTFTTGAQTVWEGGKPLYFRAASATRNGARIVLFFIDRSGAHADAPARAAASVRWTD